MGRSTDEMSDKQTTRRRFVQTTAVAGVLGLAGCSGDSDSESTEQTAANDTEAAGMNDTNTTADETTASSMAADGQLPESITGPKHGDDLPTDESPMNGYPPEFDQQPEQYSIDTDAFDTATVGDYEVPLVPADIAYYWYARGEARFVDARSESEYQVSNIFGSVLSTAADSSTPDPVYDWPKDDRVVTYCDCPHHLATMRAGDLLNRGWENVYAIDEGFGEWRESDYPLAGTDTDRVPTVWTIEGEANRLYAGETAWARHTDSDQKEGTKITEEGTYTLHVKFVDVTGESTIEIETPGYSITGSLEELASGYVTEDGELESSSNETTSTSRLRRLF